MKTLQVLFRFNAALLVLLPAHAIGKPDISAVERLFTLKVKPLLSEKCIACHGVDPKTGEEKLKGKLDLRSRDGMLKGGESIDHVLVPGSAAKSFFITAIKWEDEDYEMPPKENDRLNAEQIEMIAAWIDGGAPWPGEERQAAIRLEERQQRITEEGEIIDTSGGLGEDWTFRRYRPESIWAFKPVVKPELPELSKQYPANRVQTEEQAGINPIDAFVFSKLEKAGLEPAPRAEPLTLLRRLSFDLTGLPPSPEETEGFLTSWKSDPAQTWTDTIDRLLASPQYGERWAQHWLDVVRYADTSGYSNDWERSNAWRFRDYVIRSFNQDKPWNRFILEQLAGDELEPGNPELTVATGFLRMGPWEHTPMTPDVESRQLFLDDLVNVTGQAFLSTTMRCFKCHDHKFDPLPTRDYYRVYAAFATTQPAEMKAAFLATENRSSFEESRKHVEELLAFATKEQNDLYQRREDAAKEWYTKRGLEYKDWNTRRPLKEAKPPRFVGLSSAEQGLLKVREQDARIWKRCRERYEPLAQGVYNGGDLFQKSQTLRPPVPTNKSQMKKSARVPESHIYSGGSVYAKGEKVTPGVLSVISLPTNQATDDDPYRIDPGMDRRRLSLARWIAHPENPLTTRSIVNRVWHYHFGRGLAGNPNNFGGSRKKPTHPELLDYLAANFVEDGWSVKKLHKLILTSEAWKMASDHPKRGKLAAKDPSNDLLWVFQPRRLTAEELRDSMLAVTGELNLEQGGLPVFPEINREVAFSPRMIQFSLAPAWQPSRTPAERNRRSVYTYRVRGLPDPLMQVFNRPSPDDSCERRDTPSVTPQVFTLLNSEVVTNRSIAFARRLEKEVESFDDRLARAFHLAFNRPPMDSEREVLESHYEAMVAYHRGHNPKPVDYPTHITRSLVEEFSGDSFEYEELLNAYQNYTSDPQAADVSPETRALADVAMLVFNANEFIFLY